MELESSITLTKLPTQLTTPFQGSDRCIHRETHRHTHAWSVHNYLIKNGHLGRHSLVKYHTFVKISHIELALISDISQPQTGCTLVLSILVTETHSWSSSLNLDWWRTKKFSKFLLSASYLTDLSFYLNSTTKWQFSGYNIGEPLQLQPIRGGEYSTQEPSNTLMGLIFV